MLALVAMLLGGCSKAESKRRDSGPAKPAAAGSSPAAPAAAGRSLVTEWTVGMTVDDTDSVASSLRAKTEELGGYVASSRVSEGDGKQHGATLELRVPSDKLGELRSSVRGFGELTTDAETTEDVTEARADLEARLAAARAEETRILELMQNKTGSIADVLETEKELARIRENIERLDAERRALVTRVDFAKVHVTLNPNVPAAWSTPGESVAKAWHGGLHTAKAAAVIGAMVIVAIAPFVLPLAAFAAVVYFAARRLRRSATPA
jgi:Domain of unknown function (DUF4349)